MHSPTARRAIRRFLMWLILATLPACDNVSWGGTQVRLTSPPPRDTVPADSLPSDAPDSVSIDVDLPRSPVLFMGTREGDQMTLVPLAEWRAEGPQPLPNLVDEPDFDARWAGARLLAGAELALFAEGGRAGTLSIRDVRTAVDWCEPRLAVHGEVDLVPGAAGIERFLALHFPEADDGRLSELRPRPLDHTYEQRVAGIDLAIEAVGRFRADWPGSMVDSRQDMQAIALEPGRPPAIAATFVYRDTLAVAPPASPGSYGLTLIGEIQNGTWQATYTWYRVARSGGKAIARVFSHGDLDNDGRTEVVLEVVSSEDRGAVVLERDADGWREIFTSRCSMFGLPAVE
jgi:hypothetical protein